MPKFSKVVVVLRGIKRHVIENRGSGELIDPEFSFLYSKSETTRSERTEQTRAECILSFRRFLASRGKTPLEAGREDAIAFKKQMAARQKAPATICLRLYFVHEFSNWLLEQKLIERHFLSADLLDKLEEEIPNPVWTGVEMEDLFTVLESLPKTLSKRAKNNAAPLTLAIGTAYRTGARITELTSLTIQHAAQCQKDGYMADLPYLKLSNFKRKGKKHGSLWVPEDLVQEWQWLWSFKYRRHPNTISGPQGRRVRDPHIFLNSHGTPLATDSLRKYWSEACFKAGVRHYRFHELRHLYAHQVLSAAMEIDRKAGDPNEPSFFNGTESTDYFIRQMMGHSQSSSMQPYIRANRELHKHFAHRFTELMRRFR